MKANQYLRELYLDYVNNFLTVDRFAEHHGIQSTEARRLLAMGKYIHEDYVSLVNQQSKVKG